MFSLDLISKCVKRHMNTNFKTNLVAMLALATTALGSDTCLGMQSYASADRAIGTGIVQPAPDDGGYHQRRDLPPIVSPSQVSPSQSSAELPPIVSTPSVPSATNLSSAKFQRKKMVLLSPIESSKPTTEAPSIDPTMAPPAIIQASNAFDDTGDNSRVAQAAQWGPNGYVRTATSSAGVPLYPVTTAPAPPTVSNEPNAPARGVPPIISADSQLVSPNGTLAPVSSVAALPAQPAAPPVPVAPPNPTMLDPSYAPAPSNYSQGSGSTAFAQGSGSTAFAQGSSSTAFAQGSGTTVLAPPVESPTTFSPGYLSGAPIEAPVISSPPLTSGVPVSSTCGQCSGIGCSDCGVAVAPGGAVTSNCSSCGNNGCYNADQVLSRAGTSGLVPAARRYLLADALFYTRTNGDEIINSNFGALDGFDFGGGLRLTYGAKSDSLRGREITYQGISPAEESETRTNAAGLISSPLFSTGGLPASATSAFQNVTEQTESQSAEFHSLEFNRVTYGWDVIKSFAGFRYIYLDDDYQTNTLNTFGDTGEFQLRTFNHLLGVHIGGELFYDVGRRLSYSLASKAGVFVNFSQVGTQLTSNGTDFIDVDDNNATFSTLLEFSLFGHYQLAQTARFRLGYNVLFLGEVATAQDNFNPLVTPISATQANDGDDIVFHGLNFGLEIFR